MGERLGVTVGVGEREVVLETVGEREPVLETLAVAEGEREGEEPVLNVAVGVA